MLPEWRLAQIRGLAMMMAAVQRRRMRRVVSFKG